jgi:hypothetical protein
LRSGGIQERPDQQDRTVSGAHHLVGDAPDHHAAQDRADVRAEDDQVNVLGQRLVHDAGGGGTGSDQRGGVDASRGHAGRQDVEIRSR